MAALVLTVGLGVWAFSIGGGGDTGTAGPPPPGHEPVAAPQPSTGRQAQPVQRRSPQPEPEPNATVTVTATPKATVTVTTTPKNLGKQCRQVAARLTVRTDKNAYGDGARPEFVVRVKPKKRCLLDPDRLRLVITSGTDRIWSSRDCGEGDERPLRVTAGMPYRATTSWERVRSNPARCGEETSPVQAGWYVVKASLGEHTSNEAVFRLK